MNRDCFDKSADFGPEPYVLNVNRAALQNENYRTAVWTGELLQMTLMSIPVGGEIGLELHKDTDQYIRVEQGCAAVKMGICREHPDFGRQMCRGEAVFVPAGTWHNVVNIGRVPLKISSIYAPPHHPRGTVQREKEEMTRHY